MKKWTGKRPAWSGNAAFECGRSLKNTWSTSLLMTSCLLLLTWCIWCRYVSTLFDALFATVSHTMHVIPVDIAMLIATCWTFHLHSIPNCLHRHDVPYQSNMFRLTALCPSVQLGTLTEQVWRSVQLNIWSFLALSDTLSGAPEAVHCLWTVTAQYDW